MKVTLFAFLYFAAVTSVYAETPSHCDRNERIIFSCQIKNSSKILSLCASKELSDESGYLQYRFGKINRVELQFPDERNQSQKQFLYRHHFRYQADLTEIGFVNQGHEYTIYSFYEGNENGSSTQEEGVRVDNTDIRCSGKVEADFAPLKDAIPCDEESALGC